MILFLFSPRDPTCGKERPSLQSRWEVPDPNPVKAAWDECSRLSQKRQNLARLDARWRVPRNHGVYRGLSYGAAHICGVRPAFLPLPAAQGLCSPKCLQGELSHLPPLPSTPAQRVTDANRGWMQRKREP